MSRILLADDSPHAQRMGERILSEEGFEVVTVSDGDSALIRLDDVDPDLVLAHMVMPRRTGYEVCQFIKISPHHRHIRVLLTAGAQEKIDDAEVERVRADGVLKKPFEASILIDTVKPLLEAAAADRKSAPQRRRRLTRDEILSGKPIVAVLDPEQVKAAVTVALDASMASMVDQITEQVLLALADRSK